MKKLILLSLVGSACGAWALPRATDVTFVQNGSTVTITYSLTESPAIVTLDIQTNVTGDVWASIGGANIMPGVSASSAAFRTVTGAGPHEISWVPARGWPDHNQAIGKIRAVVTAWSPADPPDYMAVDITDYRQADSTRYYPGEDFVPGGVLGNTAYRTSMMLLRRIHARNQTFTMGSFSEYARVDAAEKTYAATLSNDYYMAVFETTQSQWALIVGNWPSDWSALAYRAMRPVEKVSYADVRSNTNNFFSADYDYPNPPGENSFLGLLNRRTGLVFDLPSEVQWEFACRAGHGEGQWGNGSHYDYAGTATKAAAPNSYGVGRTSMNTASSGTGFEIGTAECGTYPPNSWGLYDMHGNVSEWCVDFYADTLASTPLTTKSRRGGSYYHAVHQARSASRNKDSAATRWAPIGFRVICPIAVP